MSTLHTEKKFVFIHVPKTGGASIAKTLKAYTGHQDIAQDKHWVEMGLIIGIKWKDIYSFGFVRNPYTRFQSLYRWYHMKDHEDFSFKKFADTFLDIEYPDWDHTCSRPQYSFIGDPHSKRILVDFVGKYENLAEDWKMIANKLGLHQTLPHLHNSDKTINATYTPEIAEKVEQYFTDDFDIFGYERNSWH